MQSRKNAKARILSLVLAVAMAFTYFPQVLFATTGNDTQGDSNGFSGEVSAIEVNLTGREFSTDAFVQDPPYYQLFRFTTPAGGGGSYTFYSEYIDQFDSYGYLCTESQYEALCRKIEAAKRYVSVGSDECLIYNDDGGNGYNFYINYDLEENTTYYFIGTRYRDYATGRYKLVFMRDIQIALDNQGASQAGTENLFSKGNLWYTTSDLSGPPTTTIVVPEKQDHTFGGYYTEANGAGTQVIGADGVMTDAFSTISVSSTIYAKWISNLAPTFALTVDGSYAEQTGAGEYEADTAVSISAGSRYRYAFSHWSSSNGGSFANPNSPNTTFTMPEAATTITANWSYNGTLSGDSYESDSSDDSSSNTFISSEDYLTTGQTTVTAPVDRNGNATVFLTDKAVADALKAAQNTANNKGLAGKLISIEIVANTNKQATQITATLPKSVQEILISNNIDSVKIITNVVTMGFSQTAIRQINDQARADVTITATRSDTSKLTGDAKALIGSRPMFSFNATYGNNTPITDLEGNTISIAIPYTLNWGESSGNLYAINVDGNDKASKITNSSFDSNRKAVIFTTSYFSNYAVGYQSRYNYTDITNHWAKTDIEFVTNRGLMSGTTSVTFDPNAEMTLGMFVTALGKLAGINSNNYTTNKFTDVETDAYYAPYAIWATESGIVDSVTTTAFGPDKPVNREQMAVIMSNYAQALGHKVPGTRAANVFVDDRSIGNWAGSAVKQMQMAGVLNSKSGNKFDPTANATRGEAAAVLHRYVDLVIDPATAQGLDINDSGSAIMYENGAMVKSASRTVGNRTYSFNANGEAALL